MQPVGMSLAGAGAGTDREVDEYARSKRNVSSLQAISDNRYQQINYTARQPEAVLLTNDDSNGDSDNGGDGQTATTLYSDLGLQGRLMSDQPLIDRSTSEEPLLGNPARGVHATWSCESEL